MLMAKIRHPQVKMLPIPQRVNILSVCLLSPVIKLPRRNPDNVIIMTRPLQM